MKLLLAGIATSAWWSVAAVPMLRAQVLITGEDGGKGSRSAMISANAIQPKDFGMLTNIWVLYGYGATGRVEAFWSYDNITVFGRSQSYAAIGQEARKEISVRT